MGLIKCPACGRDVSTNAAACPQCGEPINKSYSMKKLFKLRISRKKTLVGCAITVSIYINGISKADFKSGDEFTLEIAEGKNEIVLFWGGLGKNVYEVDVQNDFSIYIFPPRAKVFSELQGVKILSSASKHTNPLTQN